MTVRELMTPQPEACLPADSCAVAGEQMRRRACGFLPVVESRTSARVVGVVTDRDLALALARLDRPASQVAVADCMTRDPNTIHPDAELEEAAKLMESIAVHRLPVVEGGRLVGVFSLKDLALAARREWAHAGAHRAERQMTEIIEAIAAAQSPKPLGS